MKQIRGEESKDEENAALLVPVLGKNLDHFSLHLLNQFACQEPGPGMGTMLG